MLWDLGLKVGHATRTVADCALLQNVIVGPHALDVLCEAPVEDHGLRIGVVPDVREFLVGVAVVGVHRDHRGLLGPEKSLEVLVAVVEVLGDLRLVAETASEQRLRHTCGASIEFSPGSLMGVVQERPAVAAYFRSDLPRVCEVPASHRASSPPGVSTRAYCPLPGGVERSTDDGAQGVFDGLVTE